MDSEFDYDTMKVLQGPGMVDDDHVGYFIETLETESPKRAIVRLPLEDFNKFRQETKKGELTYDNETWSQVEFSTAGEGCRDTNPATMYLTVTNLLGHLRIPFGIDADSGSHLALGTGSLAGHRDGLAVAE